MLTKMRLEIIVSLLFIKNFVFLDLRDKRSGQDDSQPTLVFGGQNTNLKGLNPALLSAL